MRAILAALSFIIAGTSWLHAFTFPSIDGGDIDLDKWRGQPVLVVNTASLCGFTYQYDGLQALYDRYRSRGLVVLAVPSNDFKQELATGEQVKKFCAVNFNLTIPMTTLSKVRGPQAHPFYQWVNQQTGFVPNWNFNKVLIDRTGSIAGTWRSTTRPDSRQIVSAVEEALPAS